MINVMRKFGFDHQHGFFAFRLHPHMGVFGHGFFFLLVQIIDVGGVVTAVIHFLPVGIKITVISLRQGEFHDPAAQSVRIDFDRDAFGLFLLVRLFFLAFFYVDFYFLRFGFATVVLK